MEVALKKKIFEGICFIDNVEVGERMDAVELSGIGYINRVTTETT